MAKNKTLQYIPTSNQPSLKDGGRSDNFTTGGTWEILKEFKGASHARGGINIEIGNGGIRMSGKDKEFKAAHGLVIAASGLIMPDDKPKEEKFKKDPTYEAMSLKLTEQHKDLNWVKRGINPDKYPLITNEDESVSSHKLCYGEDENGKAYVFPMIIQKEDGSLHEFENPREADDYAKKTNTTMPMPSVEMAKYYSINGLIKHY